MIRHLLKFIWNRKRKNALLTTEIFLSFLILFAASSAVIYFLSLYDQPKGFEHENVWIVNINNPYFIDSALTVETKRTLKRELTALPQIEALSFVSSNTPYSGNSSTYNSEKDGISLSSDYYRVDEDFAKVMGLNVVEGKWFETSDRNLKDQPVVISKRVADEIFRDTTAIGSIIPINSAKVMGVIDNFKSRGEFMDEKNSTFGMIDEYNRNYGSGNMMIKIAPNTPAEFEAEVNKTIQTIAKDWPFVIEHLSALRTVNNKKVWIPMIMMIAICFFLVLNVALGLFGVLWYNINHRKSEIGLRRSVGASKSSISSQFILEMLLIASIGVLLGVFFAIQVPLLKMFDVDRLIFIKAILFSGIFIYLLVFVCTLYPSRQAGNIQPAIALHDE